MKKSVDYIIVGQGLAGTFLAFQLLARNKTFLVIDKGHQQSSSKVASGLMNPLVLKRLTVTWRADEFLQYNPSFFQQIESVLGKKYFFKTAIKKLISSSDEMHFWKKRFDSAELKKYINRELEDTEKSQIPLANNFKFGAVKNTSWLNIGELLTDFRTFLLDRNLIYEKNYEANLMTQLGIDFKNIVFCEGASAINNSLFNWLPFSLNKGHLMTIKTDQLKTDFILKKKVFVLPISKDNYKVGATYEWNWEDEKPNKKQIEILKNQLLEMIDIEYEVTEELTGIRPSVKDRRPLMGSHPEKENHYIFNGLGSRGCFMAPLLSNELIDHIELNKPLHAEVVLDRFNKE